MTTCVKDHAVDRILHKEGKSRAWLASQTGLHHKTIHRALSNENATGDTIFAICRALDWRVLPNDFFDIPQPVLITRAESMIVKGCHHA